MTDLRRHAGLVSLIALMGAIGCSSSDSNTAEASESPADAEIMAETDPMLDQTAYGFDDFDMDGDSELDADEFHEWAEAPYLDVYTSPLAVDADLMDGTTALDANVLIDGLYMAWDRNDDDALDRTEWAQATTVLQSLRDTTDAWIEFDMDGSNTVDIAEVRAQIESDIVVAAMDQNEDGMIADYEMNEWFFDLFDVNENGTIDRNEWRVAELYLDVPTL